MGVQSGISGKESHGLCQSVPVKNAEHHWSTCMEFQPKSPLTSVSGNSPITAYQSTPSLNIIHGMNSDLKISCEYKNFNPM